MVFMLIMMFAFVLIAATTVAMTIVAMSLMQWVLEHGRSLRRAHTPGDSFLDDEAQASSAMS
jgi:hypothetical protein